MPRSKIAAVALGFGFVALVIWRVFVWRDPNYLYEEEFKLTASWGMTPTEEMGTTLWLLVDSPCAGAELDDQGYEIGMRLVREGAPDARVDFPLERRESGLAIEVRHPRIAAKGEDVQYTLYGAGGVVTDQWTLIPTID